MVLNDVVPRLEHALGVLALGPQHAVPNVRRTLPGERQRRDRVERAERFRLLVQERLNRDLRLHPVCQAGALRLSQRLVDAVHSPHEFYLIVPDVFVGVEERGLVSKADDVSADLRIRKPTARPYRALDIAIDPSERGRIVWPLRNPVHVLAHFCATAL